MIHYIRSHAMNHIRLQGLFNFTGPALGSALYIAGGFLLPFLVVGIWCTLGAIGILFAVPNVNIDKDVKDDGRRKITLMDLAKVRQEL